MSRRTIELLLLLAVIPILGVLFAMAILSDGMALSLTTVFVPSGLFIAFLAAHLTVRRFAPAADPALLPLAFLISGVGIAFVLRLAPDLATRQVIWLFVGVAAMIVVLAAVPSISKLTNYKYTIMIISIILLLLPMVIGVEYNGSKIWLSFFGFSFQPGEIAKVLIVLFLAGYLADNRELLSVGGTRLGRLRLPDLRTLAPLLIMWVISMLIVVFERDLGSALLFFGIFLVMIYVATGRAALVAMGLVLAVGGFVAAYYIFPHVQVRVQVWLDPFAYRNGNGYQIVQALYSLADGGLLGTGIGRGMPGFIPLVSSDFIFPAIAEEMGYLGAGALVIAFLLFAVRGLTIAARAKSDVEAFTAAGLTAAIALQAIVIIGGTTRLIPLTGVTLPFMSQGGSSLLASFIIVGLLLRAGDSGTGLETEMTGVATREGGILGRLALGKRLTFFVGILAGLFAIVMINLGWYMIVQAPALNADPNNSHLITRDLNRQRGSIVSADGVTLADSVETSPGVWTREYPEGTLAAHVIGYRSATYGAAGIESDFAQTLTGQDNFSTWGDAINTLAGVQQAGSDVHLTIDTRVQAASEAALADQSAGAVIVMKASTGEILSMASYPTYDPNQIDSLLANNGDDGSGPGGGNSALFNRATQALYAPGSTFKTVTLITALSDQVTTLDTRYDAPSELEIGNAEVTNYHMNNYGNVTLERGFELSANTVFAQVADQIGAQRLVAGAENLGFNKRLNTDFSAAVSLMPDPSEMTEWETAWAGVGQPVGEHKSPPGPQATV
ncbi:MAG: FtsW/RodA/SpoVE family cell cycle protein, partial [Coriobacteriia bacterium]|nr:FtsW/RodA/SpoVE family cell cycle protein [Coriobacteriia bacterium]